MSRLSSLISSSVPFSILLSDFFILPFPSVSLPISPEQMMSYFPELLKFFCLHPYHMDLFRILCAPTGQYSSIFWNASFSSAIVKNSARLTRRTRCKF